MTNNDYATTLNYVTHRATEDETATLFTALRAREKQLRAARAGSLKIGDKVTLANISPKAYEGVTGTIQDIVGRRCVLHLDAEWTDRLRTSRTRGVFIPSGVTEYDLDGIPLTACKPAA